MFMAHGWPAFATTTRRCETHANLMHCTHARMSSQMPALLEVTGLIAASLTTFAFLPQVLQTWRSRSTAGLNLPMLVVLTTGLALWLFYGLGTGQLPVILANGATLALVAVLLVLKLRDVLRGPVLPAE